LFYYRNNDLRAVRSGPWKLHTSGELYNLGEDIGEKTDVAEQHADIVLKLNKYLDIARLDLGDADSQGENVRPAGWIEKAKPLVPN
jgi:arylsulfatase A